VVAVEASVLGRDQGLLQVLLQMLLLLEQLLQVWLWVFTSLN